jgi:hypothetical protein
MHILNRPDHTTPVIAEHYLHRPARDELGSRAMMPCILLALPNPPLSFMAGVPDAEKLTGDQPRRSASAQDHSGIGLRNATAGLCLLAAAAAVVSFTAQYRLIYATRRLPVVAGLEAAIPDAAALVFASLGIALALHGRRAIRARILNLASVGTIVFMNTIAAAPGWRNLAVWAMPPVAYALASDTLITVVRAAIARQKDQDVALAPRGEDAAGRGRRAGLVAAAPGPGARLHPGRVPRLGGAGVPGRPRSPPSLRAPAGLLAVPCQGPAARQNGPVPDLGNRTARVSVLDPARARRHRAGHRAHPGRVLRLSVPARPAPAWQPRPPPAGPPAPAAAPRQKAYLASDVNRSGYHARIAFRPAEKPSKSIVPY